MDNPPMQKPEEGLELYCVGGAVRDRLLKRPVKDRDWVVVGSNDAEMRARGFKAVGKSFPVYLHPGSKEEYALARRETKIAPGYNGFEFQVEADVTLLEDLARRDLSINAIAEDREGRLVDPFGGQQDLRDGILRHVSPAFQEDPVRVLRIARFLARYQHLGFSVHPATLELLKTMVSNGEVSSLVAERVWQELHSALGEKTPVAFIRLLRQCGALAVIFPELDNLYGIEQSPKYHPEGDAATHTLMVLQQAAKLDKEPIVRFAALVHDLGKAKTPVAERPRHIGHERRGLAIIRSLCRRIRVPGKFEHLACLGSEYHLVIHRGFELRTATIVDKLGACGAWHHPDTFSRLLKVCKADALGRGNPELNTYPQAEFWLQCLKITAATRIDKESQERLEGKAFGDELRKQRITALDKWRKQIKQ